MSDLLDLSFDIFITVKILTRNRQPIYMAERDCMNTKDTSETRAQLMSDFINIINNVKEERLVLKEQISFNTGIEPSDFLLAAILNKKSSDEMSDSDKLLLLKESILLINNPIYASYYGSNTVPMKQFISEQIVYLGAVFRIYPFFCFANWVLPLSKYLHIKKSHFNNKSIFFRYMCPQTIRKKRFFVNYEIPSVKEDVAFVVEKKHDKEEIIDYLHRWLYAGYTHIYFYGKGAFEWKEYLDNEIYRLKSFNSLLSSRKYISEVITNPSKVMKTSGRTRHINYDNAKSMQRLIEESRLWSLLEKKE